MAKRLQWIEPLETETEIENSILEFLNYQIGVLAFKVKIKATYDSAGKYYRKLPKYCLAGTPDIIACFSIKGLPILVGMEVKTENGIQSKDQKDFQQRIQDRANGFYFVVRSIKDAEEALKTIKQKVQEKIKCSIS